jgi:glycosyltransferase involved in cell wall biosynthesis
MRVLLDATYAARAPYSGTGVYVERLVQALSSLQVEVDAVANHKRRPPAGGGLGSARNLVADWLWTSVELPRLAKRAHADLIHHPLPARTRLPAVRQVVTVHDLAFERHPELFDRGFRMYAQRAHRAAAWAASAVICVSETTAADVRELWGVDPDRIVVARHGPGQAIQGRHQNGAAREHFLYVGDAEPRKNLSTLTEAYARYRQLVAAPLPLVVAGSVTVDAPGVTVVADPDTERLGRLYCASVALIQPSLYEGFGITALEAMSVGAPVIASDIPALRETCGHAAEYIDPRAPDALARTMLRLADEPRRRAALGELGLRRAAQFSWDSSARAHVAAYSLALGNR